MVVQAFAATADGAFDVSWQVMLHQTLGKDASVACGENGEVCAWILALGVCRRDGAISNDAAKEELENCV